MEINPNNTVDEAKRFLKENFDKGADCPCCGQFVKLYKRRITSSMALALILLYGEDKKHPGEWIHVANFLNIVPNLPAAVRNTGDVAKFTFWGLVEKMEGKREDGNKRNGFHRITQKGRWFVEGRMQVPKFALLFDNRLYGLDESKQISIHDALRNRFDYNTLMQGL